MPHKYNVDRPRREGEGSRPQHGSGGGTGRTPRHYRSFPRAFRKAASLAIIPCYHMAMSYHAANSDNVRTHEVERVARAHRSASTRLDTARDDHQLRDSGQFIPWG